MTGRAAGFVLQPIGRAETPWSRGNCPKNMAEARATGRAARLLVEADFRAGLKGLARASHLIVLGWFADVARDVLVQHPAHLAEPQGCFALRSPARPNPIGVSVVRLVDADVAAGAIDIEALDWFDGTALLDIKPYFATTDCVPDAHVVVRRR